MYPLYFKWQCKQKYILFENIQKKKIVLLENELVWAFLSSPELIKELN